VRDPQHLIRVMGTNPSFLQSAVDNQVKNLRDWGIALGRRFRALKLWAVLRCHGRSGLQEHIRRGISLAARFEEWVAGEDGWELCAPRPFSVVSFRHSGSDERNRELLERVNASGEIFISGCVLDGRYALRLAVGNMRTTEEDVARAWEVLRREAADL
jgi:aromatic-L-amino-acid decarboxylase